VLLSVAIHGGALMVSGRGTAAQPAAARPSRERITLDELKALQARGERVILLDVRKDRAWDEADLMAQGAIRMSPDDAPRRAAELALPRHNWLVAYCA
jgi:rhodanese-related sulfurtransferase